MSKVGLIKIIIRQINLYAQSQQFSIQLHHIERKEEHKRSSTVAKNIPLQRIEQPLRFFVGPGNNGQLVKRVLSKRGIWSEAESGKEMFINFRWHQSNKNFKYDTCIDNRIFRHSLNHFQYHHQLSNKEYLFKNFYQYCENHKLNAFEYIPLTFILNLVQSTFEQEQTFFVNFYNQYKPDKISQELHLRRRRVNPNHLFNVAAKTGGYFSKYEIKSPFIIDNSPYLWILKPTFYNRGNGVHVFNTLPELQGLMNRYIQGVSPAGSVQSKPNPEVVVKKSFRIREARESSVFVIRSNSFVIQKYMEKPLLFSGRKFDIRMWVLVTHELKIYLFKEGYLRTSSYQFNLNSDKVSDLNVHLTNNAVQKYNEDYGRYQLGNQLSFDYLKTLITDRGKVYEQVMEKIRDIIRITGLSVKRKLNKQERSYCFQVFGYDFMLDEDCNPWLIEVNTNPCLQESSPVLQQLLPRMLDDAFALTIDQVYDYNRRLNSYFSVNGYEDSQNLWKIIVDLKK